ncbi:unnamed protein product [Amoebophrya sp. A120]|nr:unnamed protein product [Amoebophrya sp. A120]|eukprot:GSA120T00021341001.1
MAALAQYSLVMMLILASLLGSALNPLTAEAYPDCSQNLLAAYNMLSMIICSASLFGTAALVLESIILEGTPAHRIHSIIAEADNIFHFGTNMLACGLQGTVPLILLRAWVSGLDRMQCIVLTAICGAFYCLLSLVYFRHLQNHWPVVAQRWTKLFAPFLYKRKASSVAVDELVAELRYLQQPRDKILAPAQLGACLERYLASLGEGTDSPAGSVVVEASRREGGPLIDGGNYAGEKALLADLSAFLHFLETEAGGRLSPMMERLAKRTFEKVVNATIDKLADEAIKQQKL